MMIRCIIIDDEYPARVLLKDYIQKISFLKLTGSYKNPVEAIGKIQSEPADLIFLDIQMPELSGIEFLRAFPQKTNVILTTAYSEYALTGYELNVIDYLLKPISFERFIMAVNKAAEFIRIQKEAKTYLREEKDEHHFITIKADHKIIRIAVDNILYVEGLREYVTFFTGSEKIVTLESLKNLENQLPGSKFIRVHKSYIINKDKVKSLYGNQLEIEGKFIPIGKSYKDEVVKKIFD